MEQSFLLKYYGKLTLFEQANMTAEEREWYLKRLSEEIKSKPPQLPASPNNPS